VTAHLNNIELGRHGRSRGVTRRCRRPYPSALAEIASEQQLPIPYSPHYEGIYFDRGTLRYTRFAPGDGLTCATFILAVFDALGIPLVKAHEWVPRDEDAGWLEYIVQQLEEDASPEHIEQIRAKSNGVRYRPEEVVGALTESAPPIGFARAEALGRGVLDEIAAQRDRVRDPI
jgi:hypothetical protein